MGRPKFKKNCLNFEVDDDSVQANSSATLTETIPNEKIHTMLTTRYSRYASQPKYFDGRWFY